MKILLCLPFEPEAPKGNSIAARRLARGFEAHGHQVTLLGFPAINDPEVTYQQAVSFQPDLCLVMHAWRCAKAVASLRRYHSAPLVISLRGTDLNEMLDDGATRPVIAEVLHHSHGIVVFHQSGRERLAGLDPLWGAKTRVIPNGVVLPVSEIDYRVRLGIDRQAFLFLAVSGLREVKRPLLVLPWLEELSRENLAVTYAHAGMPLESDVAAAFSAFAASHRWLLHLAHVPHDEIDSFLRAGQVFVASSRSEGMPHAVREAMLSGLPALLSDIDGHRNLATAEHEALFFHDRESFLAQAKRLMLNPELRRFLGENSRTRAWKDLIQGDEISSYLTFFTELVHKEQHQ